MEEISYEKAMEELSQIIESIEEGNTSLSQTISMLEKGKTLIEICYKQLDGAKGKLTEIKENLGKLEEV